MGVAIFDKANMHTRLERNLRQQLPAMALTSSPLRDVML
jgi:hypothetical protein